jgi:2,3-bisphosphoglycerate-dependent phosphoglycerate mutase
MQLILLRHGESEANKEGVFAGWQDVPLTEHGREQAIMAGKLVANSNIDVDIVYTSVLTRAVRSAWAALEGLGRVWIPIAEDWRLNERHYGALEGLRKDQATETYGPDSVRAWRRSFQARPPAMKKDDPRYAGRDIRYRQIPHVQLPVTESLADALERILPCWQDSITASLRARRNVMLVAHCNTIRALIKHIERLNDDDIVGVEVPSALPLVYQFGTDLRPCCNAAYLGDFGAVAARLRTGRDSD